MDGKLGLLERLDGGEVIVGDGGVVSALEKRGYVKAGVCTPECVIEDPEAVRQLHREFLNAGADIVQAFTFHPESERSGMNEENLDGADCMGMNIAACALATEVASDSSALVAASVSHVASYEKGCSKDFVQQQFRVQAQTFAEMGVDFVIAECIEHVEEMEWAIEVMKETGLPVVATLTIGKSGDLDGVSPEECGVRMVRAGADCVGINCMYDPKLSLQTMAMIIRGVREAGLKSHYVIQSCCFHCPDGDSKPLTCLPESPLGKSEPLALEPRLCTRFDIHKYARAAYDLGIRYIGGCCGFEPYHIRAIAEELAEERGKLPRASQKHGPWGSGLRHHSRPWVRARARREYWEQLKPASGRPDCPSLSRPVTKEEMVEVERCLENSTELH